MKIPIKSIKKLTRPLKIAQQKHVVLDSQARLLWRALAITINCEQIE